MVLNDIPQDVIETNVEKPKKPRNPRSANVKNSEVRDFLENVLASNEKLNATQDKLTSALLEAMDKIETMSVSTEVLAKKIDDIQTGVAACQEEIGRDDVDSDEEYQALTSDAVKGFVTTREIFDKYSKQFSRRDGELANQKFLNLLEKLCAIHEDYNKLCSDINSNIDSFSAREVLKSFEAYLVDFENMLQDAGVTVGPYGSEGSPVNVMHQRIVGIVPTADPSKNGTIAKRMSAGYEYDDRAILKEKVQVYKAGDQNPDGAKTQTGFRMAPTQ